MSQSTTDRWCHSHHVFQCGCNVAYIFVGVAKSYSRIHHLAVLIPQRHWLVSGILNISFCLVILDVKTKASAKTTTR